MIINRELEIVISRLMYFQHEGDVAVPQSLHPDVLQKAESASREAGPRL